MAPSIFEAEYSNNPTNTVIPSARVLGESTQNKPILKSVTNTIAEMTVHADAGIETTYIPDGGDATPYDSGPYLNSSEGSSQGDIVAGGASDHHSETIIMLTYVFYSLALAALVQFLIRRLPTCIRPPYAVTLFALGAFLSYLHHSKSPVGWALFSESIGLVENINPEIVFFVILPPLLYESGSNLNWHVFRRLMWSAFILAFPGVLLNLFFIGIFAFIAFGEGWTLPVSFLLGSMLSTTDPVAVVAALHNLHAPDKLALLIDGESLLNDGSAIVGVLIFQNMIETGEFSFLSILDLLFRCAVGGCLFGMIFAVGEVIFLKIINKFDHSMPALETAVVIVGMFLCYLVGDLLHMSGIIAVVSLAITMAVIGKGAFSPEGQEAVHAVVQQLAYFANQMIWLAGGHMTAAQLSQSDVASDPINWIRMIALYLVLNIARGVSTWIMFPTLTRMGYGLNLKETIMLIYAGLRGAICIALALLIRRSHNIGQHTLNEMGFYVAGAVMLTLVVNGSTIESLYRWLKIYPKTTWAQIQLQRALAQVDAKEAVYVEAMKKHWFFKGLNLQMVNRILPGFSKAEFNVETGEVHIPMEKVKEVMSDLLDRFDTASGSFAPDFVGGKSAPTVSREDNGFLYSALSVRKDAGSGTVYDSNLGLHKTASAGNMTTFNKASSSGEDLLQEKANKTKREGVDRLVRVVQLSDTRVKSVGSHSQGADVFGSVKSIAQIIGKKSTSGDKGYFALFQCNRPMSDFVTSRSDETANPFATFEAVSPNGSRRRDLPSSSAVAMEYSVSLPDMGIHKDLMGSTPKIVVGLSPWCTDVLPGEADGSCGLFTESKDLLVGRVQECTTQAESEFKRDFVRGDKIKITVDIVTDEAGEGIRVTYMCGRYFVAECVIKSLGKDVSQLHPTVGFLLPEEQAELSFPLRTTTSAETRTESNAYILNAAICLYEDLFRAGTLSAQALRVLCDSVEYGIDAANDDLQVISMQKRVKTIKKIYTKDRGKYEAFDDEGDASPLHPTVAEEERLSPLETEWGFLQLRHMKRVDCNHIGSIGFFLRLGELFGIRYQYRHTYRKIEELLAYSLVHSDLVSHAEMARFPETLDLVTRLVLTSKSYLVSEVWRASPRDFYVAQHVLAAKILLQIRRQVLNEFTKEGSLSTHSVHDLDEHYITKQLLALKDYTPSRPRGSSRFAVFRPPRTRYATGAEAHEPELAGLKRVSVHVTKSDD